MTIFSGSGPGVQTRDGCSVELYRGLPYRGWLEIPIAHLQPGSTVLELGCGAGQGTKALLDRGFVVTAVDNSREMLAHAPAGATTVLADIETLDLKRQFDAVILPTGIVNHPIVTTRRDFFTSARRHTRPGGWFFVERQDPRWLDTVAAGDVNRSAEMEGHVDAVSRTGDVIAMTLRFVTNRGTWSQSFQAAVLKDQDLQALLSASGFGPIEWLNERRTWFRVQASRPPSHPLRKRRILPA